MQQITTLEVLTKQQQLLTESLARFDRGISDVEYVKQQANTVINNLPDFDSTIKTILEYAQSAQLQVNSFEVVDAAEKALYQKKTISLTLQGSFFQILDFFQILAASCVLMRCRTFSIMRIKEGLLQVVMTCALYSTKGTHENASFFISDISDSLDQRSTSRPIQ